MWIARFKRFHFTFPVVVVVGLILASCASSPNQAPIIERDQTSKKPATLPANKTTGKTTNDGKTTGDSKTASDKDWRPETYIVKKGDTLFSIGLQYGYDYKEIAQLNNLTPPYSIRIGQELKLKDNKTGPTNTDSTSDGVVTAPLKTNGIPSNNTSSGSAEPGLITEPKALREPYSEQALLSKPVQTPAATETNKIADSSKPGNTAKPETVKTEAQKDISTVSDEAIDWAWPTNGKVVTSFNESTSAKGIDIGGVQSQAINAAAAGRVIYSGSDLRGYGKLVIIKHNKSFLSVYAHNNLILVKEGQQVSKGQKIAEMGNTDANSYILHFEIRQQGKSIDPSKLLPNNP